MLLDDLLEARVVELGKLGEVVHVRDDVAEILLEHLKVLFRRPRRRWARVQLLDHVLNLLLRHLDPPHNLAALDLLEGKHLVELVLENLHKVALILLGPHGRRAQPCLELRLEIVVRDVVVVIVFDQRRAQLLAEPSMMSAERQARWRGRGTSFWRYSCVNRGCGG